MVEVRAMMDVLLFSALSFVVGVLVGAKLFKIGLMHGLKNTDALERHIGPEVEKLYEAGKRAGRIEAGR